MMIGQAYLALILVFVSSCQAASPSVTWYFRGEAKSNYSLVVNTGSTLVLGCKATGGTKVDSTGVYPPAFVLTKGSNVTSIVTTAAQDGVAFVFTPSGGTLLWDSFNGHTTGYDYIIASVSIPLVTAKLSTGYVQFFIPYLRTSDSGVYYCTFFDGSATYSATTTKSSDYFQVTVQTISASGSPRSAPKSKAFEYSLALLGASKFLF